MERWAGWNLIWKTGVQQRIRELVWMLTHEKLLSNVARWKRGMSDSALCQRCNKADDDILHIFRDCRFAREVWYVFNPLGLIDEFISLNLRDWVWWNLNCSFGSEDDTGWPERMSIICWSLWRWRNTAFFDDDSLPLTKRIEQLFSCFKETKLARLGLSGLDWEQGSSLGGHARAIFLMFCRRFWL